jgi:hypothetical protein
MDAINKNVTRISVYELRLPDTSVSPKKRKNLQVTGGFMQAGERFLARLETCWRNGDRNEHFFILSGGGDMGHDMDCHFSATGSGRGAGLHILALCARITHHHGGVDCPAAAAQTCPAGSSFCILQGCCVFGFNFLCFYTAAAWINTGLESVIFSMAVLFNAVNSFLFFGQKPPSRFYPAAILGLTGIVTLFWDDLLASGLNSTLLLGIGLSMLGTFGFSLGNMISMRHQRNGLETMTTNAWAMLYGTIIMGAIALFRGDDFTPEWTFSYLGALVYLALWIGHCLWRLFHPGWPYRRQ